MSKFYFGMGLVMFIVSAGFFWMMINDNRYDMIYIPFIYLGCGILSFYYRYKEVKNGSRNN